MSAPTQAFITNDRTRAMKATAVDDKLEIRVEHGRLHLDIGIILTHEQVIELRDFIEATISIPDFERKDGSLVCDQCKKDFYHHPKHERYPWLVKACSGNLYKL
jgi:hypothetical protein